MRQDIRRSRATRRGTLAIGLAACVGAGAAACDQPGDTLAPAADLAVQSLEPFTVRAPLEGFHINRPPDFVIESRVPKYIVIQRSVFAPGPGGWHTHPGPTFVVVTQGLIKLTRYTGNRGCEDTAVHGPGQAYFETGSDVHRATVLSAESAVLLLFRLNIPVGGAISVPASDPGC